MEPKISYYPRPQPDGTIHIYRDNIQVATYDPVAENIEWLQPHYRRFSNHVTRVINALTKPEPKPKPAPEPKPKPAPDPVVDFPDPEPTPEEPPFDPNPPASLVAPVEEVARLKRRITDLEIENGYLKDELARINGTDKRGDIIPERFRDEVDLTGAPPQDPSLGDLTPEFVEWARDNMPIETFLKRYDGRLKQLNSPNQPETTKTT